MQKNGRKNLRRNKIEGRYGREQWRLGARAAVRTVQQSRDKAFYRAVKAGDLAECRRRFAEVRGAEERKELANTTGPNDVSVLLMAITMEYPNLVKLLLSHGADPTYTCDTPVEGSTPLSVAVASNRPFIIKVVCEGSIKFR